MARAVTWVVVGAMMLAARPVAADQPPHPAAVPVPVQTAVHDDALQITGEELAARERRSRLSVDVFVNDHGPFPFIVDSGADTSVLGHRVAALTPLPAGSPATLRGMTEVRPVEQVLVDTLRLGSSEVHDLEVPVLDEAHLGAQGLIGLDALRNQRLMLDFETRKVTIGDREVPLARADGVIVVRGHLRRGQLILTKVRAANADTDAVIDTGSEITVGNAALRARLDRRTLARATRATVYGVTGGPMAVEVLVLDRLQVGPIVMSNVAIAFAEAPPFATFGLSDRPALLLGTDVMSAFRRISLDFKDRKVRFQLRSCDREAVRMRTHLGATGIAATSESACRR